MHYEYLNTGCDMCQVVFSMFNKLLICLCLADLLFLVSNLAISPIYVAQVDNIPRVVVDNIYWISTKYIIQYTRSPDRNIWLLLARVYNKSVKI